MFFDPNRYAEAYAAILHFRMKLIFCVGVARYFLKIPILVRDFDGKTNLFDYYIYI